MKSLKHQGVLVLPKYQSCGYMIFLNGKGLKLNSLTEEMAFAWVRKLTTPYANDPVFRENFFKDFCSKLGIKYTQDIKFEQLIFQVEKEKYNREHMTKEEKKELIKERKKLSQERKEKYGYAWVDGKKIEISNFIAEPSSLFLGRGSHPLRGRFKFGPTEEDIILNLSKDSPVPKGKWKKIEFNPNKMYIAYWDGKLNGKRKYVWLSDAWSKKQEKEKAKFQKAEKLEENLDKIRHLIGSSLHSTDIERRKLACVSYLIYNLNLRVGDEKEEGETDTCGALTLRKEHMIIDGNKVHFDFLGKDSVRWIKDLEADIQFVKNLREFLEEKDAPFEGLTSKQVAQFLSEAVPGISAKVFRTYVAGKTFKDSLKKFKLESKLSPEEKKEILTRCNLEVAKVLNHKKALPKNFSDQITKAEERIKKWKDQNKEDKVKILKKQLELKKDISEWNLNTSRNAYINPLIIVETCSKLKYPIEKIYNKGQMKKHFWAINSTDGGENE